MNLNIDNTTTVTSVTSTTLAAVITGISRLNVACISGPQGPTGPSGAQGPQGPAGPAGTGAGAVGVISLNSLTGILGLGASGAGLYASSTPSGLLFYLSGVANSGDLSSISASLNASGNYLYGLITGASGAAQTALNATGAKITSLSGYANATFATIPNLALTGQALYNDILSLSGLVQAASAGVTTLNGLSGVLAVVGTGGLSVSTGSGRVVISGDTSISGALTTTGANLQGQINTLTTNLTQSGVGLGARIDLVSGLVGATGTAVWNAQSSNALNLSGTLAVSGAAFLARDLATSGALDARLALTGSGLYALVSGLTGNLAATGSSLQTQINTLTLNLTSTGLIIGLASGILDARLSATGQQAWSAADANARALSGALTNTGLVIGLLSGYADGTYVHRTGVETISGAKTFASLITSSGGINMATGASYQQDGATILTVGPSANFNLMAGVQAGNPGGNTGTQNTYVGYQAGMGQKAGQSNVALGIQAAMSLLTGTANTVVGAGALRVETLANNNTVVGNAALGVLRLGDSNVSLGMGSLGALGTGNHNIALGSAAGGTFASGDYNIFIGDQNNPIASSANHTLSIGDAIFGSGISNVGNPTHAFIGINTGSPNRELHVVGSLQIDGSGYFLSGVHVNGVRVLTGLIGGTNITVANNGDGTFTVNGSAASSTAGVTGLNSFTGAVNITGAGTVSSLAANGLITLSGNNNDGLNISGQMAATGAALIARDLSISGALQSQITLASAGVTSLNGLSGALNVVGTGGLSVSTGAGRAVISGDTSISGALTQTGLAIGLLSGALATLIGTTGAQLYSLLTAMSGQANTNYATVSNLQSTGQALYADITGLSGQAVATYATLTNLALTGQQAWGAADANARALSGALTQTGTLLSAFKVTGSSIIPVANLTGLGGTLVIWSGNQVFISGAAGSSAGVSSLNALTNAVVVVGTGGLSVLTVGQNVLVSGDFSISGALSTTGAALIARDLATSGALDTRLFATGSGLYALISGLTGNLGLTGSNLQAQINTLTTNLTLTGLGIATSGSQAWNAANNNGINLSGQLTLSGAILLSAIAATGANLQQQIYALTGLGTSLAFDFGRNIVVPSGQASFPVTFSRDLGATPLVIPILSNNSGDPALAFYPSGVTSQGFTMVLSAAPPTSGYRLSYLATTGSGYVLLGQNTGATNMVVTSQLNSVSGWVDGTFVHRTGDEAISGSKTFYGNLYVTGGNVGIGTNLPDTAFTIRAENAEISMGRLTGDNHSYLRLGINTGYDQYLANNATYTTGGWQYVFTGGYVGSGSAGFATRFQTSSGTLRFDVVTGGLNPITWTNLLYIDRSGHMGLGLQNPSQVLDVAGNVAYRGALYDLQSVTVSANYAVAGTESRLYLNNTVPITVTLPSAVAFSGYVGHFKLLNTGTAILTGTVGQTFDGSPAYVLNGQYNNWEVHSNGANWFLW